MEHVKADFAFYLLLAYDFDSIYTILSSFWKDYMIKPEKKNVCYQILDGGGRGWWQELDLGPTPQFKQKASIIRLLH